MGWIACIFFAVAAVLAATASIFMPGQGYRQVARKAAAVGAAAAVAFFVIGGIREVPTRSVGVPTAFGSVQGSMRPGLHWRLPWTTVNILDETIQTTTFEGAGCLTVRIGGQQTACLDVTLQWRVQDSGAAALFNDYNGKGSANLGGVQPSTAVPGGIMGTITDAVVIRELEQVVNEVLGDYNPVADVAASATAGNSQFSTFGPVVLRDMQRDLAGRIQVMNAFLPLLRYDPSTQSRLNTIQVQVADTAIAGEEYQTNVAQARANAAIAGQVSPAQLEYECLQMVQAAIKAGYTGLPATLSCLGDTTPVTVGGK